MQFSNAGNNSNEYDPMKDIKKQHGEYLRQQIKINEDKKLQEKQQNIINGNSNNNNNNTYVAQKDVYYNNQGQQQQSYSSQNVQPMYAMDGSVSRQATNKIYGEYLRQQVEENDMIPQRTIKSYTKLIDEKQKERKGSFSNGSDKVIDKVQQLQELMAAKQENPFGKGGSGAPLVNKNGQVIASRKPDPSQVQQQYETRDNNNAQNFIGNRGNTRNNGIAQSFQDQFSQILENRDFNKAKQQQYQQQVMYPSAGSNNIPGGFGAGTQPENGNNYNRSNNKRLLQMENESKEDQLKRAKQRNEISAALKEQMEEKERQKKLLKNKEAEEELRIEERIKKDREDMEKQIKEEEQIKKNKTQQLAQDNQQLILQQQQQRQQQEQQSQATPIKQHKGFQENSNFNYNNNNNSFNNNNNNISNQNKNSNPDSSLDMQKTQLSMNFGMQSKPISEQQSYQLTQQQQQLQQLQLQSQQLSMRFAPRLTYSSEQRSRDIIPELEGLKQQIQDQYKRIQIDMHRAKIENCQAIDDRNKQSAGAAIFSKDSQITDPSINALSFNNNTYFNTNPNNYPYSNNNNSLNQQFPQQARSMSGYAARGAPGTAPQKIDFREQALYLQKQQISQQKSDQLSMSKTNIQDEYQLRNQNVNSARERNSRDGDGNASFQNDQPLDFGKNSLLGGETKMIPMDLIDRLRQNDQLTMSQLINYDQNSTDNKVMAGNSANQNGNSSSNNHNSNNKWEIPTINSDLGHEIDKILISQTEQAQGGQSNGYYSKQSELTKQQMQQQRSEKAQYPGQSKIKSETAFNMAAKGILDSSSAINKYQKLQQPQQFSEESLADRINSDFNVFNSTNNNNNNIRSHTISMNNTYSDKWNNQNAPNNNNYADNIDSKSVESNELSMTELQEKLQRDNISGNGLLEDTKSNQEFATRDRVYEEPRRRKSNASASSQNNKGSDILMYSSRSSLSYNEDSDEIKKQKALREIKERFNLSTVHEDQSEKTRQLSTLLETGKYQDNRELYESLKQVDDPDFQKLDDLIKQFKSSQLLEGRGKK